MKRWVLVLLLAFAVGCGAAPSRKTTHSKRRGKKSKAKKPKVPAVIGTTQRGKATWYGSHSQGGPTASGERFDRNKMTAAHKTFPMNTRVKVTHEKTGKSVVVRINDRGPYGKGRIIDLSPRAAKKLGIIDEGVAPVVIEVVGP